MIPLALRRRVRALYDYCCGYCGVTETDYGAELTIDRHHPRAQGGGDAPANLVYACFACNTHKGDYCSNNPAERLLHLK